MDEIKSGGPAFPRAIGNTGHQDEPSWNAEQDGMSRRDYFAGQALALGGEYFAGVVGGKPDGIASVCYDIADAMLKASEAN